MLHLDSGYPSDILEAEITGVQDALKQLTEAGATDPVIKATVVLSESGFTNVQDVLAFGEIKDDSLTSKLKSLLNNVASSETESGKETETEARPGSTSSSSASASGETASDEKKEKEKEKPKDTIPLKVEIKWSSIPPMTAAEKRTARDR